VLITGRSQNGRNVCRIIVRELSDPIHDIYKEKINDSAKIYDFAIALVLIHHYPSSGKMQTMITRALVLILTALSLILSPGSGALSQTPQTTRPTDFRVEFFPVAPYHIGDVLSARVTYTGLAEIGRVEITLALADQTDQVLGTTTFSSYNRQAVFYWYFDTHETEPGFLDFRFSLPARGISWTQGVHLLPDPGNRDATWSVSHSQCCILHYLIGTDAEADLTQITEAVEERSAIALSQFAAAGIFDESPPTDPLPIVLIPVVVGHGGFATDEAVLTYNNNNWTGIEFGILAHHEMVHVIDRLVNTEGPRPAIFVEGLAVYLSGGHYREGDPLQRAAALLALDMYLPLNQIVNNFYAAQHEIGYMQAAALVAYLDQLWGWETFIDFYFNLPEGPSDAEIISAALTARFGLDLAVLEQDFITYLATIEPDPAVEADVRLTVEAYDMLRRYQTLLIPSAHFRTAWWPPVSAMREGGIVGDYGYRENNPLNVIIEHIFIEVHAAFLAKDYQGVESALDRINLILEQIENKGTNRSHYAIGWPIKRNPAPHNRP
jgi:hypothetical protein